MLIVSSFKKSFFSREVVSFIFNNSGLGATMLLLEKNTDILYFCLYT